MTQGTCQLTYCGKTTDSNPAVFSFSLTLITLLTEWWNGLAKFVNTYKKFDTNSVDIQEQKQQSWKTYT